MSLYIIIDYSIIIIFVNIHMHTQHFTLVIITITSFNVITETDVEFI